MAALVRLEQMESAQLVAMVVQVQPTRLLDHLLLAQAEVAAVRRQPAALAVQVS